MRNGLVILTIILIASFSAEAGPYDDSFVCEQHAKNQAEFDVEIPPGSLVDVRDTSIGSIVKLNIKTQNGFGAWQRVSVFCVFENGKITNFVAAPGWG